MSGADRNESVVAGYGMNVRVEGDTWSKCAMACWLGMLWAKWGQVVADEHDMNCAVWVVVGTLVSLSD